MVILGMNHALAWQLLSALGRHHRTFEDIRIQNLKDAIMAFKAYSRLSSNLHSSDEFSVATAEFRFLDFNSILTRSSSCTVIQLEY